MSAEHYQRMVDAVLPSSFPSIARPEAVRVYARLVRHFGGWAEASCAALCFTTQTNMRNNYPTRGRRCWISSGMTGGANHHKGWGRLIHDFSHSLSYYRHPSLRAHDPVHAKIEREVAQYVVAQGWLTPEGSLSPKQQKRDAPSAAERTTAAIDRWTMKLKRAENALRKLRTRRAAQLRRAAKLTAGDDSANANV